MWIIFGLAAIGATLLNLTVFMMEKDYKTADGDRAILNRSHAMRRI